MKLKPPNTDTMVPSDQLKVGKLYSTSERFVGLYLGKTYDEKLGFSWYRFLDKNGETNTDFDDGCIWLFHEH